MINWEQIYKSLISKRGLPEKPKDIYTEVHHIIPKYLGGNNLPDNLVRLYLKDHTLAHYILWRWRANLEDRVAYLMKGGQTEDGNKFRIRMAQEALKKSGNYSFRYNNPMSSPEVVRKARKTRILLYDGKWHSEQGLRKMKQFCNSGNQHSPEAKKKMVESLNKTRKNMSDSEYYSKYVEPRKGESNPNFGRKRPGDLAGNYGTSKGTYTLKSPDGQELEFKGIKKLKEYGVGEHIIRSWRNKGIIKPQPNNNRSPWIGYEIIYKVNPTYGKIHKKIQKSKRNLNN